MQHYDVVGICNALVDILIEATDEDLRQHDLSKGMMHLVENDRQRRLLAHFAGSAQTVTLGGSSLNAIKTLAGLDINTAFAGMVGQDDFGTTVVDKMTQAGIAAFLGSSTEPTGSCLVLVTPDGERTMNTHLGASRLYTSDTVPVEAIKNSKFLHFCGYQWDTDGQKAAIELAVKEARQAQTKISFDLADPFVIERNKSAFHGLIAGKKDEGQGVDIVFANREEAQLMFDCSPEEAASQIAETGTIAVIKLGAEGALVQKGSERVTVAAEPATVIDTTGAGDMFAAGFLYGLCHDLPLGKCGKAAAIAAGDVIERMGANVTEKALQKIRQL